MWLEWRQSQIINGKCEGGCEKKKYLDKSGKCKKECL